jgi:hypothetical protein
MSKKLPPETDPIQSENFRQAVRDIEADGGPSPTEADATFERALSRVVAAKKPAPGG